jgi:hypothetical protein
MPLGEAPYGVADARPATRVVVNRNGSPQFKKAHIYSADTNQSSNFFFDTQSLAPDRPLGISKNTYTSVYGARAGSALSNPAGV